MLVLFLERAATQNWVDRTLKYREDVSLKNKIFRLHTQSGKQWISKPINKILIKPDQISFEVTATGLNLLSMRLSMKIGVPRSEKPILSQI